MTRTLFWLAVGFALGWAYANREELTSLYSNRQRIGGAGKIIQGLSDFGNTV